MKRSLLSRPMSATLGGREDGGWGVVGRGVRCEIESKIQIDDVQRGASRGSSTASRHGWQTQRCLTHTHTGTLAAVEMLTTTHHHSVSSASLPPSTSIHCIQGSSVWAPEMDSGCTSVIVCVEGWAAVASVSPVAKRAALPELYLKPERTALWMRKGERENVERSSRGAGRRAGRREAAAVAAAGVCSAYKCSGGGRVMVKIAEF